MILTRRLYRLDVEAVTREGDAPDEVRLRALLKHAGRVLGLRCRRIEELPSPAAEGAANPGETVDLTAAEASARTPQASPGERGDDGAGVGPAGGGNAL